MKQTRWPKYKTLPLALAIYLLIMSVYGWRTLYPVNPTQYWLAIAAEVVIIVVLYFLLKYQHDRKKRYDEEDK
jgi:phosphatidylglycerophosphate synthase